MLISALGMQHLPLPQAGVAAESAAAGNLSAEGTADKRLLQSGGCRNRTEGEAQGLGAETY